MHARRRRCGCFREPVRDADLFDAPLPVPAVTDPFAAFHRESRDREDQARKRGVTRQIGAERQARYDFTHASLRGGSMKKHNVLNCTRRIDGQYAVIVADTCGGKNQRQVISDRPVKTGTDVMVSGEKVIHS